jgi:hypothetical protein
MNFGTIGILVIFAAFVLLLVLNPNMSCFGRRIKSPFYPLLRRRKRAGGSGEAAKSKKPPKTEDYGFR